MWSRSSCGIFTNGIAQNLSRWTLRATPCSRSNNRRSRNSCSRQRSKTYAASKSNHVKPILLYLPTADDLTATNPSPISKIKKNVSDALGVPLVDLTSELRDAGKTLYLEGDSVHLDSRGNKLIAKQLFQTVTNLSAP